MLSIASLQINLHLLSHCIFIFNLDRCDVPWLPSSSSREEFALVDWCRDTLEFLKSCSLLFTYYTFFHHYQRSIDFNTVNIHRTVGMYFLVSTGNRGDIEWHDLQRSYYPIHSLLLGVYVSILPLGTVFPHTLPWANIRGWISNLNLSNRLPLQSKKVFLLNIWHLSSKGYKK